MRFKGDSNSDKAGTFPEGQYFLTCTHVQHKNKEGDDLVSKKGNPMWVLEMTVSEGQFKDRKLWHHLVFIPAGEKGHGMALKCLKAFGLDPEGEVDIFPDYLEGVTIRASVKVEQQEGYDPANKIAKFFAPEELRNPGTVAQAGDPQAPQAPAPPAQAAPAPAPAPAPAKAPAQPPAKKAPWGGK